MTGPQRFMEYGMFCMEGGYGAHWFPEETRHVDQSIKDLYNVQPPLFYPRLSWPRKAVDTTDGEYTGDSPFIGFDPDEGSTWGLHLADVHSFLEGLAKEEWATGGDIFAILKIVTRGIENAVAVIPTEMIIRGYPEPAPFVMKEDRGCVQKGQENVPGMPPFGPRARRMFGTRELQGRRFWVTLINYTDEEDGGQGKHWAIGIFDRRPGVFYFYDPISGGRTERAKAAGLMWRNYLGALHLPYTFLVVSPDISSQRKGYECGYLACFNAILMLRCLVGQELNTYAMQSTTKCFSVDQHVMAVPGQGLPLEKADLPIFDWAKISTTYENAFRVVKNILGYMCIHELGVKNGSFLGNQVADPSELKRFANEKTAAQNVPLALEAIAAPIPFNCKYPLVNQPHKVFTTMYLRTIWNLPEKRRRPPMEQMKELPPPPNGLIALWGNRQKGSKEMPKAFDAITMIDHAEVGMAPISLPQFVYGANGVKPIPVRPGQKPTSVAGRSNESAGKGSSYADAARLGSPSTPAGPRPLPQGKRVLSPAGSIASLTKSPPPKRQNVADPSGTSPMGPPPFDTRTFTPINANKFQSLNQIVPPPPPSQRSVRSEASITIRRQHEWMKAMLIERGVDIPSEFERELNEANERDRQNVDMELAKEQMDRAKRWAETTSDHQSVIPTGLDDDVDQLARSLQASSVHGEFASRRVRNVNGVRLIGAKEIQSTLEVRRQMNREYLSHALDERAHTTTVWPMRALPSAEERPCFIVGRGEEVGVIPPGLVHPAQWKNVASAMLQSKPSAEQQNLDREARARKREGK